MSKLILGLLVLFFVVSCGVKNSGPVSPTPAVQTGDRYLPTRVNYTANRLFLIRSSVEQIQVGEEKEDYNFRIDYAVTTADLTPFNDTYTVEVKYGMPSMPLMKIRPAVVSYPEAGKVSVLYRIDMAQDWRMELTLSKKDGSVKDAITYNYYIPE